MFTFDGNLKTIFIDPKVGDITFSAIDLYSSWKRWVMLDNNARFVKAFNAIGGNQLSATKYIAGYIEVTNDWKIKPPDGDYTLTVEGNLFATGGSTPFVGADSGTVIVVIESTGNALALDNSQQATADITAPVWDNAVGIIDAYQSDNGIVVRWAHAVDARGETTYRVYISKSTSTIFSYPLAEFTGNMTTVFTEFDGVTELLDNTYYIAVRAVDNVGNETDNVNYATVPFVSGGSAELTLAQLQSKLDILQTAIEFAIDNVATIDVVDTNIMQTGNKHRVKYDGAHLVFNKPIP